MKFSKYTIFAIDIAKKTGNLLKKGFSDKKFSISNKEGIHNLVTNYDIKAEKLIINEIHKNFPSHSILSEEKGLIKPSIRSISKPSKKHINYKSYKKPIKSKDKFLWIIDPLDGTVNFAHKIPIFCVSIALKKNDNIISSAIYAPLLSELFYAEEKKGSYLCSNNLIVNTKKLKVSNTKKIENSFLGTCFPYNTKENPKKCINKFLNVIKMGIPTRRIGSAALGLSYVADARFDGFWAANLGPWDVAAASLIIKEAKGKVYNLQGNSFKISNPNSIIATNTKIDKNLFKTLNSCPRLKL